MLIAPCEVLGERCAGCRMPIAGRWFPRSLRLKPQDTPGAVFSGRDTPKGRPRLAEPSGASLALENGEPSGLAGPD